MTKLDKLLTIMLLAASFSFGSPMEPAKSTLFILLDGMSPANKGLLQNANCVHYENSDVWGKTGAAKYLQENIANAKANIYSRSYKNPADAPSSMVSELAGHNNAVQTVSCIDKRNVFDASKKNFSLKDNGKKKLTSIIDEALESWFAEMLEEVKISLPQKNSDKISLQKTRNAWSGSVDSYTPNSTYSANYANIDPYLYAWVENYKNKNGSYPTLKILKNERPDFLPSRYVFIANGMGGMVAREYIQGLDYQGDVDKVLFINTPHEGTGFADQALLSKDDFHESYESTLYVAALTTVSLLYMIADDFTREKLVDISKVLIEAISASGTDAALTKYYFGDYDKTDPALWYLAQDLDKRDHVYESLISSVFDEDLEALIGRTQMLNYMDMLSEEESPLYRVIYSYGMPSIGNSRRGYADFIFQKKTHYDAAAMEDFLTDLYRKYVTDSLVHVLTDLGTDALKEITGKFARSLAKNVVKYGSFTIFDISDFIDANLTDDLAAMALEKIALPQLGNAIVNAGLEKFFGPVSQELGEVLENLPSDVVDFLSAVMYVMPPMVQNKIVSAFVDSYSPKYDGMMLSEKKCNAGPVFPGDVFSFSSYKYLGTAGYHSLEAEDCAAEGQANLASSAINYSVNFFDQGTHDVPVNSAFGGSVGIFDNSDVKRYGYPLHTMDSGSDDYDGYRTALTWSGRLESNRKTTDGLINTTCMALDAFPNTKPAVPVCRLTQFIANTAFIGGEMISLEYLLPQYDVLKKGENMALKASLEKKSANKTITLHSGNTRDVAYSDMDYMLYEDPYLSLQMASKNVNGIVKGVPFMFTEESGNGFGDVPEIVDLEQAEKVYGSLYAKTNGGNMSAFDVNKVYAFTKDFDDFKTKKLNTNEDYYTLSLRNVNYKKWNDGSVTRQIDRKEMPAILVKDEVKEYRFQIDDLRPDLIWQIKLDFNLDVQFYFERNIDGTWDTYIERNGKDKTMIEKSCSIAPVNEMGLFVFRPMQLADLANAKISDNNKRFAHNKIQAEGPNLVSVSVINAVGLSSSHQFSFYYQATLPYLQEGWPTYLQTVSSLDDIYITASNQGDPYTFTGAEVCLIKAEAGVYSDVPNSCIQAKVSLIKQEQQNQAWAQSWRIDAHMGDDFIGKNNVDDGNYIIQWKLSTKDATGNVSTYKMNVSVFVDTKKPNLNLNISKAQLTNTAKDAAWAKILNNDNSSLRATRIFAIPENTNDTVWIKKIDGTGVSEINIAWGASANKLPQGKSTVYVQSVDYAEPNMSMGVVLQDLYSENEDEVNVTWKKLLESDGKTFKKGINGVTLTERIHIDREAPVIDESTIAVTAIPNVNKQCSDCPAWNKPASSEIVLNSAEWLKLSFGLSNSLADVAHDTVRIQVILTDLEQSLVKSFVAVHDFKVNPTFTFVDSSDSNIPDGKYALSLIMIDEAHNSSEVIDLKNSIRVDRTLPIVNSVVAGEPVYAAAADVDKAAYTVSSSKLLVNESAYSCYQKLSSTAGESGWSFIGNVDAEKMKDSKRVSAEYSMKNAGLNIVDGRYSTIVGCYDESGNFSRNEAPFSVGLRFPVLTYPTSNLQNKLTEDYIQIAGVAPNPLVPGGSVASSEYKVEWRLVGDSKWNDSGISSTGKTVSTLVNNLAIWDRSALAAGDYEVRLSVRGCSDANDSKCDWVSTVETVSLDAIDPVALSNKPRISFKVPVGGQVPGGKKDTISAQLLGVNDGSQWSMDMKVIVSDPYEPSRTVIANNKYLDSMIISPFGGKPAGTLPNGLSIWQDKDEWTIKYVGTPNAVDNYSYPGLVLKYTRSALEYTSSATVESESYVYDDPTRFAPELDFGYEVSPAYNYTSTWNLQGISDFELKFKTSEPFILDVSSIKNASDNMYCGVNSELCSKYFALLQANKAFGTLFVNVGTFKMDLEWDGLTVNDLNPGSSQAKVVAVATEKYPGTRVVVDSTSWNLMMGNVEIVSDYDNREGRLIITSEKDSKNPVMQFGEVGYEFGIVGRNAFVTVQVKDPDGNIVKTLMNKEYCVAGTKKNAKLVSWNGVSDAGFASIKAGKYEFEVNAIDEDGNKATPKVYPFDVVYAGHLIAAPEAEGAYDKAAVLMMEEAMPDENGELRFIGKPDYLLTADAEAQVLPEESRELEYSWDWKGKQYPAFYRANRFSLGIRRQRQSFPVTLVTMMSSLQFYLSSARGWNERKHAIKYKIKVDSVTFDYDNGGVYEINNYMIDAGNDHIIGFNNAEYGDKPQMFDINFKAKVFSGADYRRILGELGGNEIEVSTHYDIDEHKEDGTDEKKDKFDKSFSDVGAVQLWNYSKTFYYDSKEMNYEEDLGKVTAGCSLNEDNGYVCDENMSETFNPHAHMLSVSIKHVGNSLYFGDRDFTCIACRNDCSARRIFANITFKVNDSYWNPKFGYNNLANKYVRFDHTNKTLFDKGNYFNSCENLKNYYDGMRWTHSDFYGLVTPFEVQRFTYNATDCPNNNPLQFPDESVPTTPSKYQFGFMVVDNEVNSDEEKYKKVDFVATAIGSVGTAPVAEVITSKNDVTDVGKSLGYSGWLNPDVDFYVTAQAEVKDVIKQHPNEFVAFPYNNQDYKPKYFGSDTDPLCKIDDSSIRSIDDQENHCFWYYPAASRIQSGVDEFFDAKWYEHFGVKDNWALIKNPMYESLMSPMSSSMLLGDLNKLWMPDVASVSYKKEMVMSSDYDDSDRVWKIVHNRIDDTNVMELQIGDPHPDVKPEINLSPKSVENGWMIEKAEDGTLESVYNVGVKESAKVEYVRADDVTPLDANLLKINAIETITSDRLAKQNKSDIVAGGEWIKNLTFSNAEVFNRKDDSEHEYFVASVSKDKRKLEVQRTNLVPQNRIEEIASLRGQVPNNGTRWTLSFLSGTRMVPIASDVQKNWTSSAPYPLLSKIDVDTLQGNTSFFLTYGLDDAAGDVYFKQLDVHIGELLNPSMEQDVSSMYQNVSVHFPKDAFETEADVTVRVANISDFDKVFQGLYPVGTVVEVLPSHVFDQSDSSKWPRVSIEVTEKSLGNQDPLDVRIYKPDTKTGELVPLEVQELAFYDADDNLVFTCGDQSGVVCHEPTDWAKIRVSGKTSTFSNFMLMDKDKAALVKPAENNDGGTTKPNFACDMQRMPLDTILWAGLVNGYLAYPYPCDGESNYMVQLLFNNVAVAEFQGETDSLVQLNVRKNDFLAKVTPRDTLESRLALYGSNNKNMQVAGPMVRIDTTLPVIEKGTVEVDDYETQKRLTVDMELSDAESGVALVDLEFYWAGKLIDRRRIPGSSVVVEDFIMTKKMVGECSGCKAEIAVTVYDQGHNYVKSNIVSESVYPFPKSLVLWYPLADGAGSIARELTGTGVDLALKDMFRPWLYGTSLHFGKVTDVAAPSKAWNGIGSVPMSVEFKMKSNVSRGGTEFSILGWDASVKWVIGLKDAHDLFFEYKGERIVFNQVNVKRGVESFYVFTLDGKNICLYKDGELVERRTLKSNFVWNSNGKPVLGVNGSYNSVGADLSGIRFYQAELSVEEVRDLYRGEVDEVDANVEVVRAVDLTDKQNLSVGQSCDLAGMAFLQQSNGSEGSMKWNIFRDAGRYNLYLLARGYENTTSNVEILIDGVSMGVFKIDDSGMWVSQVVEGLVLSLSSGIHEIAIKPIGYTGVAALAIANAESRYPASKISWGENNWSIPDAKVQVEIAYPSYSDKSWMKANFRLRNLSDERIEGVSLRYYYKGENDMVSAKSFYPDMPMSIVQDAADVYFAELRLPENLLVGGSVYGGNGPQIGAFRTNNNAPWNFDDDPSFEKGATDGQFHVTDKVAVLDGEGNLVSRFSCYDGSDPMIPKTPKVRVLAKEEEWQPANNHTLAILVENIGEVAIHGFEVRYYVRESEKPILDIYSNMFAENHGITAVDGDLYYISFRYKDVILNPGEKSDYGNGVKFALRHTDGSDWNSADDASHYGISYNFAPADSAVILDLNGNVLWGSLPQPSNALPEIHGEGSYGDYIVFEPDGVLINVPDDGDFVLERVNSSGARLESIYSGYWTVGEHFISNKNVNLVSGQFLLLRKGTTILSRVLIK